jgi:hypothetical protein
MVNRYNALRGPIGYQVLEAAYTEYVHGRDKHGQINRKASEGGLGGRAIQKLLGSGASAGQIESGTTLSNSFVEGSAHNQKAVIDFLNKFSPDTHIATVNTPRRGNDRNKFTIKDVDGNDVKMHFTHAYSIESVDKAAKTVNIVNPHDTSVIITIPYATFLDTFSDIDYAEVNLRGLLR